MTQDRISQALLALKELAHETLRQRAGDQSARLEKLSGEIEALREAKPAQRRLLVGAEELATSLAHLIAYRDDDNEALASLWFVVVGAQAQIVRLQAIRALKMEAEILR